MALPTNGRVIVETSVGDIDIELWAKETPKTCRNFIQLALEGYYDGVIFHRVVPGFLVQTGDKTGTGSGGETIYGDVFEDEIHPRLKFAHRGLVAMANNGKKNSNDSQFIITLDRADELHGKHTLFGRVIGDTVYNVLKIDELELDTNGRPVYPPKIKTVKVLENPFDDIVPRITAAEKRAQTRAKEEREREKEEEARRRGAKKNVKLLSFDDDQEGEETVELKKKAIVRPDLMDDPEPAVKIPDFILNKSPASKAAAKATPTQTIAPAIDLSTIRTSHATAKSTKLTEKQAEIEKMEREIKKLVRKADSDDEDALRKKKKKTSYLEEEMAKYKGMRKAGKKGKKDEGDVLKKLGTFRGVLKDQLVDVDFDMDGSVDELPGDGDNDGEILENEGDEIDRDTTFMSHTLMFYKDNNEIEIQKAERDYEVIDPRVRKREAQQEEKERKDRRREGRSGRR